MVYSLPRFWASDDDFFLAARIARCVPCFTTRGGTHKQYTQTGRYKTLSSGEKNSAPAPPPRLPTPPRALRSTAIRKASHMGADISTSGCCKSRGSGPGSPARKLSGPGSGSSNLDPRHFRREATTKKKDEHVAQVLLPKNWGSVLLRVPVCFLKSHRVS